VLPQVRDSGSRFVLVATFLLADQRRQRQRNRRLLTTAAPAELLTC
jgi:hypothetical protein